MDPSDRPAPSHPLRHVEAVAFDFDGTLADTRGAILASMAETLHMMGVHAPAEADLVARIGLPLVQMFRSAGVSADRAQEAAAFYRQVFPRHTHRVALFPGAIPLLQALSNLGLSVGIASSRGRASLLALVSELGLTPLLSHVLGDEDASEKKPAPDLVLSLADRWAVSPTHVLVVGDTTFDMAMGRAAGAHTCGVTYGNHGPVQLRAAGARLLVDHLDELAHHFAASGAKDG